MGIGWDVKKNPVGEKKKFSHLNNLIILGYFTEDSNAAAHSVDSDIFYAVINLSARSKS